MDGIVVVAPVGLIEPVLDLDTENVLDLEDGLTILDGLVTSEEDELFPNIVVALLLLLLVLLLLLLPLFNGFLAIFGSVCCEGICSCSTSIKSIIESSEVETMDLLSIESLDKVSFDFVDNPSNRSFEIDFV